MSKQVTIIQGLPVWARPERHPGRVSTQTFDVDLRQAKQADLFAM